MIANSKEKRKFRPFLLEWVKKNRVPIIFLSLTVIVAGYLRLKSLTFQSLWLDELLSLAHSSPGVNFSHPIKFCANIETNPPFFYILLWMWRNLLGTGEYTARLLPALIGIFGVISIFFLGKELFSRKVGLYASLITSVLPFHIYYSQEVRSYSLMFLLSILSFLYLTKLLKGNNLKNGSLYVFCTSIMLYTHYFGLFVFSSQVAFLVFYFLLEKDLNRAAFLKYILLSFLFIFLLYLPWIPALIRMAKIEHFWTKPPYPNFFMAYFRKYFGNEPYITIIFLFLMLLYFTRISVKENFKSNKLLLFSWIFIVLAIPYIRSFNHPSPLIPRNTIVILPAIILMVSKGLERVRDFKFQCFLLGTIILMLLVNIFYTRDNYYKKVTKEQFREVSEYIIEQDPEHRYPIFGLGVFDYYFNDIFKQKVRINPRIKNLEDAKDRYHEVVQKIIPGFWLLWAHDHVNKAVYEYLGNKLYKVKDVSLKGAKATLYLPISSTPTSKEEIGRKKNDIVMD